MTAYFNFPCPGCSKPLKVPDKLAGKSRACPYCRATVRIPESQPEDSDTSFPNIQVAEKPATAKKRKAVTGKSDGSTPTENAPVKKKIVRNRDHQKWFSASSDAASSDVSLIVSGLMAAVMTVV